MLQPPRFPLVTKGGRASVTRASKLLNSLPIDKQILQLLLNPLVLWKLSQAIDICSYFHWLILFMLLLYFLCSWAIVLIVKHFVTLFRKVLYK